MNTMKYEQYLCDMWPHLDKDVTRVYAETITSLWSEAEELRRGLDPGVLWMTPDDVARAHDISREDAERVLKAAELDEAADEVLTTAYREHAAAVSRLK